jgi:hypothetical protein
VADTSHITIRQYYSAFNTLSGWLAALVSLSPLVSSLFRGFKGYFFPPLGNTESVARFGIILFSLAVTYLALFWRNWRPRDNAKRVTIAILLALACFCLYFIAYQLFVRRIDIPSSGTSVSVSVGYQRTEFAKETFGSATDWEILKQRGIEEEEIERLWTASSIAIARLALFVPFCGIILLLVAAFSCGVLYQLEQNAVAA